MADASSNAGSRGASVRLPLDYLHLHNYLDLHTFIHLVSQSPNTRELFERVVAAIAPESTKDTEPTVECALQSQDFGWATGIEKSTEITEIEEAAKAFGLEANLAKRLIKHPLYSYPGGHLFFELYIDVIDGLHKLGATQQGKVLCLYTHSSSLRALITYLDPRPFPEAFAEFGEYKEGQDQDNVVLLTFEHGQLSGIPRP